MSTYKQPGINYIKHQDIFFDIINSVDAINYKHIALYHALFRFWNLNFFSNPIQVQRDSLMRLSAIRSKSLYYKAIRDLESFDLIRYYPSSSVYEKSLFCISVLEKEKNEITISVYGMTNHHSLKDKYTGQTNSITETTKPSENRLQKLTSMFNGKGRVEVLKKYKLNTSENEDSFPFDPLTDPRYTSQIDLRINSSLSKNSNHANNQNSQSGRSSLRPSGIQIDPNADYSVPL
jgi:hypothetical protein